MDLENRIEALAELGDFLRQFEYPDSKSDIPGTLNEKYYQKFESAIKNAGFHNPWFIEKFVRQAIASIGQMLNETCLQKWIENYPELKGNPDKPVSVGVVMAGNIPLVGFHDFITVLISGNRFTGKLSSKDKILLPIVAEVLSEIYPPFRDRVRFTEKLRADHNLIIATGSNNTARYFNYYFKRATKIIRKNRNSLAILDGKETEKELKLLGDDIFRYFGLGCRNISKLYLPEGYDIKMLLNAIEPFRFVIDNTKYSNNYIYNRSLFRTGDIEYSDNGFVLLKEDKSIASPVGVIHYQYYNKIDSLLPHLEVNRGIIQCVVSHNPELNAIPPGKAQEPELWEYADNIDTINFLLSKKSIS